MYNQPSLSALPVLLVVTQSITSYAGIEFGMVRQADSHRLAVMAAADDPRLDLFNGEPSPLGGKTLLLAPLSAHNAVSLRTLLPWLNPQLLGLRTSAGMGDRLGLATPGHIRAVHAIPSEAIARLSNGLLAEDVPVRLNRLILDYDHLIICGPVFPHEVAGFSGGNKYFFPGIAGAEIINFTHWLGALITSYQIIGSGDTPVRAVIDHAASFIPKPVSCFSLVVTHEGVVGVYFGDAREAWQAAAALSSKRHIVYVEKPFKKVISIMPPLYDDLWTAAKGMYKTEPAIADGGEVIIYAPQLSEVSYTHGKILDQIGYHCRDFFVKQWEKYKNYPHGVLAHLTHLRGMGTYDQKSSTEHLRIQVTLATAIPKERCERIGLGYLDPCTFNPEEWKGLEDEGILVVPRAGEMLYRVRESLPSEKK